MIVGTALRQAAHASAELASEAVIAAMERAGCEIASEVLLFLTHEFAHDPHPAIVAAARAARCTQVTGCSAVGVFNEDSWVLDAPAAVALVFDQSAPVVARADDADSWRLTLMTPEALSHAWLHPPGRRCGAVSSAASGRGPHAVWTGGRVNSTGHCELALPGEHIAVCVGAGVHPLSGLLQVTATDGLDLLSCDHHPAWTALLRSMPREMLHRDPVPWYGLVACVANEHPTQALASGRYEMIPVLGCDATENVVTLARHLPIGTPIFWALRDPEAAMSEWRRALDGISLGAPAYGLLFNCLGRGAGFYGGHDRDWEQVKSRFPCMPFAGFYGNGEIAWRAGDNRLLQYSSVLAVMGDRAS